MRAKSEPGPPSYCYAFSPQRILQVINVSVIRVACLIAVHLEVYAVAVRAGLRVRIKRFVDRISCAVEGKGEEHRLTVADLRVYGQMIPAP